MGDSAQATAKDTRGLGAPSWRPPPIIPPISRTLALELGVRPDRRNGPAPAGPADKL